MKNDDYGKDDSTESICDSYISDLLASLPLSHEEIESQINKLSIFKDSITDNVFSIPINDLENILNIRALELGVKIFPKVAVKIRLRKTNKFSMNLFSNNTMIETLDPELVVIAEGYRYPKIWSHKELDEVERKDNISVLNSAMSDPRFVLETFSYEQFKDWFSSRFPVSQYSNTNNCMGFLWDFNRETSYFTELHPQIWAKHRPIEAKELGAMYSIREPESLVEEDYTSTYSGGRLFYNEINNKKQGLIHKTTYFCAEKCRNIDYENEIRKSGLVYLREFKDRTESDQHIQYGTNLIRLGESAGVGSVALGLGTSMVFSVYSKNILDTYSANLPDFVSDFAKKTYPLLAQYQAKSKLVTQYLNGKFENSVHDNFWSKRWDPEVNSDIDSSRKAIYGGKTSDGTSSIKIAKKIKWIKQIHRAEDIFSYRHYRDLRFSKQQLQDALRSWFNFSNFTNADYEILRNDSVGGKPCTIAGKILRLMLKSNNFGNHSMTVGAMPLTEINDIMVERNPQWAELTEEDTQALDEIFSDLKTADRYDKVVESQFNILKYLEQEASSSTRTIVYAEGYYRNKFAHIPKSVVESFLNVSSYNELTSKQKDTLLEVGAPVIARNLGYIAELIPANKIETDKKAIDYIDSPKFRKYIFDIREQETVNIIKSREQRVNDNIVLIYGAAHDFAQYLGEELEEIDSIRLEDHFTYKMEKTGINPLFIIPSEFE